MCEDARQADAERQRQDLERPFWEARSRIAAAREALNDLGDPGLVERTPPGCRTLLGRKRPTTLHSPAWPLGELTVHVSEGHTYGAHDRLAECGMTTDGSLVLMDPYGEGSPKDMAVRYGVTAMSPEDLERVADRLERMLSEYP